jgi:hypothetical protein
MMEPFMRCLPKTTATILALLIGATCASALDGTFNKPIYNATKPEWAPASTTVWARSAAKTMLFEPVPFEADKIGRASARLL